MDTENDDEYQRTQNEIDELQRKEEELRKKMAALANKRRSSSRDSVDNDEEDVLEIGKPRRRSTSVKVKIRSGSNSPTKGSRPGSVSPSKEISQLKVRRGSDRSHSTPETNVKDLRNLSFQKRRSSEKDVSKSASAVGRREKGSREHSRENLNGGEVQMRRGSKGRRQSPKRASTGNLYSVEIPENAFQSGTYIKKSNSSLELGKRGSRTSRDYDSFEIIVIEQDRQNQDQDQDQNVGEDEITQGKLVNGERQQNDLMDFEEDKEHSSPAKDTKRDSGSPQAENITAWAKIELELEEQKERELEIQKDLKSRSLTGVGEDEVEDKEEGEGSPRNKELNVWAKIEKEIEEERKRDEEMAMKNRIVFQEDIETDDSVEREEEEENDSSPRKNLGGKIELEIEEQMQKEMELKMLRGPTKEFEENDDENYEEESPNEKTDMFESVKIRIDKEMDEMRQRELELKRRLGLENDSDQDDDTTKKEVYTGAKGKIENEIEEFKKRENEYRQLHGVANEAESDEEIDEGLEEEIINNDEYCSDNDNDEMSGEEVEDVKEKQIKTISKVEQEIAEQSKKDKEFRKLHKLEDSDEDEDEDEDESSVVHIKVSSTTEEVKSKPNKLIIPSIFTAEAKSQTSIQKKQISNEGSKTKVPKDEDSASATPEEDESNDNESFNSVADEGISESFEEDTYIEEVDKNVSETKISNRKSKVSLRKEIPRKDPDLESVKPGITKRFIQKFDANKNAQNRDIKSVRSQPGKGVHERDIPEKSNYQVPVKEKIIEQDRRLLEESLPDADELSDQDDLSDDRIPQDATSKSDVSSQKGLPSPKPGKKFVLKRKKSKRSQDQEFSSEDDTEEPSGHPSITTVKVHKEKAEEMKSRVKSVSGGEQKQVGTAVMLW